MGQLLLSQLFVALVLAEDDPVVVSGQVGEVVEFDVDQDDGADEGTNAVDDDPVLVIDC